MRASLRIVLAISQKEAEVKEKREDYFVAGGTLSDTSPSYMERQADEDLFQALLEREFCFVLDTRQVGKSSLLVHVARKLREHGQIVSILDISSLGENLGIEQWYYGLLNSLAVFLDLEDECDRFWESAANLGFCQRWFACLYRTILPAIKTPLTLFIDEIDAVCKLNFSLDEFFAGIRETYNRRALGEEFADVAFCLSGVALPSDLIKDPRSTPFNIGRSIILSDFSSVEMGPLKAGLSGNSLEKLRQMQRIIYWTGGHPYLSQKLCQCLALESAPLSDREIDACCRKLFMTTQAKEQENNLQVVSKQLLHEDSSRADILSLYRQILSGKKMLPDATDPLRSRLLLAGLVTGSNTSPAPTLVVRNRIYRRIFDSSWIASNLPDAEVRRQRRAVMQGFVRATIGWAVFALLCLAASYQSMRAEKEAAGRIQAVNYGKATRHELESTDEKLKTTHGELNATRNQVEISKSKNESLVSLNGLLSEKYGILSRQQLRLATQIDAQKSQLAQRQRKVIEANAKLQLLDKEAKDQLADRTAALSGPIASALASHSGDELNAVQFALGSIGRLLERKRPISREAMQGLSDATCAGIYRHARLPHPFSVLSAMFSNEVKMNDKIIHPSGERLVTAGTGREAYVWDVQKKTIVQRLQVLSPGDKEIRVNYAEYSSDGKWILTADDNSRVKVWNTNNHQTVNSHPVLTIMTKSPHFTTACFSRDGRKIATTGPDGSALVWDLTPFAKSATSNPEISELWTIQERKPISLQISEENAYLWAIAFSYDSKLLVTGDNSGSIHAWDVKSQKLVLRNIEHQKTRNKGPVYSVVMDRYSQSIYSAGKDRTVQVISISNKSFLSDYPGHEDSVLDVDIGGNNRYVASASQDQTVRVWLPNVRNRPQYVLRTHTSAIWSARFSQDASQLATASSDRNVDVWRFTLPVHPVMQAYGLATAFSPDNEEILCTSNDGFVHPWGLHTGYQYAPLAVKRGSCTYAEYSPDGKWIASAYSSSSALLWDRKQPDEGGWKRTFVGEMASTGKMYTVSFSPNSKHMATAGSDGFAKIFSVPKRELERAFHVAGTEVKSAFFSPDGSRLVVACSDGGVRVWEIQSRKLIHLLTPPKRSIEESRNLRLFPTMARFSRDGKLVVSGDADNNGYVWEVSSGQCVGVLKHHTGEITSIDLSPDGKQIATGSKDRTVCIWNIADLKTSQMMSPYYTLCRQTSEITSVAYSPNGDWLSTVCYGGACTVYPASFKNTLAVAKQISESRWSHDGAYILSETTTTNR